MSYIVQTEQYGIQYAILSSMNINYFLDKRQNRKGECLIFLYVRSNAQQVKVSTGLKIKPAYWDIKRQRVKSTFVGCPELNARLQDLYSHTLKCGIRLSEGKLKANELKEEVKHNIQGGEMASPQKEFDTALQDWLEYSEGILSIGTTKKYKTLVNDLYRFQKFKSRHLSFDTIDLRFYDQYKHYLLTERTSKRFGKGLLDETVAKFIETLKTFMRWSLERGYHSNEAFKKFKSTRIKKNENIVLTERELAVLYNFDLSAKPHLERVRDLFCFACFTGQRWSDIKQYSSFQIENNSWVFRSVKTKKLTRVPFIGYCQPALDIIRKYNGALPEITLHQLNKQIKEVGRIVGLDGIVSKTRSSGSDLRTQRGPKYEFMSSHMARRTAVTLLLQRGVPITSVQVLTNHEDIETLMKYDNSSEKNLEEHLQRTNDKREATVVSIGDIHQHHKWTL